ncbi:MAG: hypothetical protein LBC18_10765 [Opitutaceae bacterium]|nr:hypothetical protein [Opitutaceae bacterium]
MKTTEKTTGKNAGANAVAVLCVTPRSHYKKMPGADAWDARRDAWNFGGGMPVVAHPPCRTWCRMRGFALAKMGPEEVRRERALAEFCLLRVRENGGVLEHPAHSLFWKSAGLPLPGAGRDAHGGFTVEVCQSWFGHRTRKETWLYIAGCEPAGVPATPLGLWMGGGRQWARLSGNQRKATPPAFAAWLVALAQRCGRKGGAA